jgi:preprotein translocase subunit SecE
MVAGDREEALVPIAQDGREEARGTVQGSSEADREPELEAPAPIAHATPDVELAEAQLAIGRPELAADADVDFDEDELEREAVDAAGPATSSRRGRGGAVAVATAAAPERRPRPGNRVITFLQGSWRELQRVQWPDRRQVMQATGVVIGFVIVAGAFLGAADWLATKIVNYILS